MSPVPVPVDPFSTYTPIEFVAVDAIFILPLFSRFPPFTELIPDKKDPDDIFIIFVDSFIAWAVPVALLLFASIPILCFP